MTCWPHLQLIWGCITPKATVGIGHHAYSGIVVVIPLHLIPIPGLSCMRELCWVAAVSRTAGTERTPTEAWP